jgi:hypothetical protein
MSHQRQSSLGFQFFLVGSLAWIGAALFGFFEPRVLVKQDVGREPAQYAPNLTAAGASVGLGIGGGLCLLGAALLYAKAGELARSGDAPNKAVLPVGAATAPRTSTSVTAAPATQTSVRTFGSNPMSVLPQYPGGPICLSAKASPEVETRCRAGRKPRDALRRGSFWACSQVGYLRQQDLLPK